MFDDTRPERNPELHDAAWNALAVASLSWSEATAALRYMLQCAHGHGLTVAECCDATGLDEPFVSRLIDEVA